MTIKEILQKAKINEDGTLDESIVAELETFVSELVELKVQDKAAQMLKEATQPVIDEARESLVKEYEQKFDEFKDTVASSFSNFVDSVLDEELEIPEEIHEWAKKGQRYSDLIDEIRTRVAVDEGKVDEEAHEIIEEARNEITSLRDQLNEAISENLEMKRDGEAMAANLYLRKKCDGLTEAQKARVMPLLEGERNPEAIDKKFTFIMENVMAGIAQVATTDPQGNPTELGAEKTAVQQEVEKECVCPKCGKVVPAANNACCSMLKCPDCDDTNLVDKSNEEVKKEVKKEEKTKEFGVNESVSARAAKLYAQLLD